MPSRGSLKFFNTAESKFQYPGVRKVLRGKNKLLQSRPIAAATGQFLTVSQRHHEFSAVAGLQFPDAADVYNGGTMYADELGRVEFFGNMSNTASQQVRFLTGM